MEGTLFKLGLPQPKAKTTPTSVVGLQYADGAVVCAHSERDLEGVINVFTGANET